MKKTFRLSDYRLVHIGILLLCMIPAQFVLDSNTMIPVAMAQEIQEEEALDGFDSSEAPDEEDAALSGFGDETPPAETSKVRSLDDVPLEEMIPTETHKQPLEILMERLQPEQPRETPQPVWLIYKTIREQGVLHGTYGFNSSYNHAYPEPEDPDLPDYSRLSKLKFYLQLDWKMDLETGWKAKVSAKASHDLFYSLQDRSRFSEEVLREHETEAELREVYIQSNLPFSVDLKFGRQILVWGKSDYLRVTDILNPLDNREPGMVDIDDLRLPVTMTRLDVYAGNVNLQGVLIHEIRFDKIPPYGSEFYPLEGPLPPEKMPKSDDRKNWEYGLALNFQFGSFDGSLYWADVFNDTFHLVVRQYQMLPTGEVIPVLMERQHSRLLMRGTAWNRVIGDWSLKAEMAVLDGLRYFATPETLWQREDLLGSIEYAGLTDTTMTFEILRQQLNNFDQRLNNAVDGVLDENFTEVVSYRRNFRRNTLRLVLLGMIFGKEGENGSFSRLSLEYQVDDHFSIQVGGVGYEGGTEQNVVTEKYKNNDRIFLNGKYAF
ncbi:MAG: hypothetical protein HQM11_12290 [SAR324 cluster bacterium]|nr:hypothetical protein [SAR324 cluster bacterium]